MATVFAPLVFPVRLYADWMSAGPYPAGVALGVTPAADAIAVAMRAVFAPAAASVRLTASQDACRAEGVPQTFLVVTWADATGGVGAACAPDARPVVASVIAPAAASRSRRATRISSAVGPGM